MDAFAFHFDGSRCTGCKTCVLACKDYNGLTSDFAFRQVYEREAGGWSRDDSGAWITDSLAYYVSLACNHCAHPACVQVCPTAAMHKEPDGLVLVDSKRCIGCGYCALTCPYHAPKLDDSVGHSVKCTGCAERARAGMAPVCVEACPQRALEFGEFDDLVERYGYNPNLEPLPPHSFTLPSLTIKRPHASEVIEERGMASWTVGIDEIV